jgi:hypothetical protein
MFAVDISFKHVPDSGYPGTFRWEFSATANEIANAAAHGKKIVGHLVSALGNSPSFIELLFDGLSETDDVISATFKEITTTGITRYSVSGDSKIASVVTVPFSGGGGGISSLLVTFSLSGETWVADKTFAEITAAIADGAYVHATDPLNFHYMVYECDPRPNDGAITFIAAGDPIYGYVLDHDEAVYDFDYSFATQTWVQNQGYLTQHQSLADYQTKAITDTGGYYTTDTVDGALQEIGAELAGINTLIGSGVIT